jgi:uroporphyrin-III C-methyltransferase/precorrin-2 dehydrogenase/sirohydrochlorin ferrochelatase
LALISKGTTPEQKVLTTTVEDATEAVKSVELKAPTLIIIGEVVRLREKLRWFD